MNKVMEQDEWVDIFKPHMDNEDLKRYWNEVDVIQEAIDNNTIWTQLDADGEVIIVNGYHHVNRMDYFITEVSYDPDVNYEVI